MGAIDSNITYKPLSVGLTRSPNRKIQYLAIHYTAGGNSKPGAAVSCYTTFVSRCNSGKGKGGSADFAVDDGGCVQFNPDIENCFCWAVGGGLQGKNGGSLHGVAKNSNTVSIEVCSNFNYSSGKSATLPNNSGWFFTEQTLNNAINLAKVLTPQPLFFFLITDEIHRPTKCRIKILKIKEIIDKNIQVIIFK